MSAFFATLRTAVADSLANRRSFVVQVLFMAVNDVTWIVFWALFFNRIGVANGWTFQDVVVMFSLLTVSAGIGLGLFANCRRVGRLAADGSLDETLILPVRPLGHVLARRVDPTNIGDLAFGVVLFALAAHPTPARTAVYLLGVAAGTVVFVGFLVLMGSLTFFTGGRGEHADLGFNAMLLFASYPLDFFGGPVKVIMFTLVPAAFVTGVPVGLVRSFDPAGALVLVAAAAVMALLASATFGLGLRRYASGSVWGH